MGDSEKGSNHLQATRSIMVELEWTPVSFRHQSLSFPLDLCVPVNQIQKQKSDRQPPWFLVHVFPKVRPELTWESRAATKRSTTGIKKRKGKEREREGREEEKMRKRIFKKGMLRPTFKTELQNVATKVHLRLAKALLSFRCQRVGPAAKSHPP